MSESEPAVTPVAVPEDLAPGPEVPAKQRRARWYPGKRRRKAAPPVDDGQPPVLPVADEAPGAVGAVEAVGAAPEGSGGAGDPGDGTAGAAQATAGAEAAEGTESPDVEQPFERDLRWRRQSFLPARWDEVRRGDRKGSFWNPSSRVVHSPPEPERDQVDSAEPESTYWSRNRKRR